MNSDFKLVLLKDILEMEVSFPLIKELYAEMTMENYRKMLSEMTSNYGQLLVYNNNQLAGVCGFWIGTKLWCGKYLELDNVIVSAPFRSLGIGKMMCDYLVKKAKQEECNMMCLDAYTDNFQAGKFYMNQGFVPRGFHYIRQKL